MQVEIWADLVRPWCYLGTRHFEQALERFPHRDEVEVIYRPFELDPFAPSGVTAPTAEVLASRYGIGLEQAREAQPQMEPAETIAAVLERVGRDGSRLTEGSSSC
jgi:predicted DsbA family dithiol-disulfide isomerase